MRFKRTIIASLAPLIGLTALLAAASGEGEAARAARPLIRLWQQVVQLAAPVSDYAVSTPSPDRPAPQVLLAFAALAVTPLGHSLWMISRRPAIDLFARRHLLLPLRR